MLSPFFYNHENFFICSLVKKLAEKRLLGYCRSPSQEGIKTHQIPGNMHLHLHNQLLFFHVTTDSSHIRHVNLYGLPYFIHMKLLGEIKIIGDKKFKLWFRCGLPFWVSSLRVSFFLNWFASIKTPLPSFRLRTGYAETIKELCIRLVNSL
jgi:hypothetical protein